MPDRTLKVLGPRRNILAFSLQGLVGLACPQRQAFWAKGQGNRKKGEKGPRGLLREAELFSSKRQFPL